jgi:hypothetical protein
VHISDWLQESIERLQAYGAKVAQTREKGAPARSTSSQETPTAVSPLATDTQTRRISIMRIRPDRDSVPPSQRTPYTPPSTPASVSGSPRSTVTGETARVSPGASDGSGTGEGLLTSARALFEGDFNFIGTLIGKKTRGVQMVERPDGRIKRYFSVAEMQEPKRPPRRDRDTPPSASSRTSASCRPTRMKSTAMWC